MFKGNPVYNLFDHRKDIKLINRVKNNRSFTLLTIRYSLSVYIILKSIYLLNQV